MPDRQDIAGIIGNRRRQRGLMDQNRVRDRQVRQQIEAQQFERQNARRDVATQDRQRFDAKQAQDRTPQALEARRNDMASLIAQNQVQPQQAQQMQASIPPTPPAPTPQPGQVPMAMASTAQGAPPPPTVQQQPQQPPGAPQSPQGGTQGIDQIIAAITQGGSVRPQPPAPAGQQGYGQMPQRNDPRARLEQTLAAHGQGLTRSGLEGRREHEQGMVASQYVLPAQMQAQGQVRRAEIEGTLAQQQAAMEQQQAGQQREFDAEQAQLGRDHDLRMAAVGTPESEYKQALVRLHNTSEEIAQFRHQREKADNWSQADERALGRIQSRIDALDNRLRRIDFNDDPDLFQQVMKEQDELDREWQAMISGGASQE